LRATAFPAQDAVSHPGMHRPPFRSCRYDWRDSVISYHISSRNNPAYHSVPTFGMAITGLLLIPFVGYINRQLRVASQLGTDIGLRRASPE